MNMETKRVQESGRMRFAAGRLVKWVAVLAFAASGAVAKEGRPNVVFIMLDDFGYAQLEAYSRGLTLNDCDPKHIAFTEKVAKYTPEQALELVKTASPTLSRMADGGVRFNNAFSSSNLCAPARIGVATGILQNRWGIYRNIDTEAHGLKPHSHLVEQFKGLGYATAHIGKWHMGTRDRDMIRRALEKHGVEDPEKYEFEMLGKKYPEIKKRLCGFGRAEGPSPQQRL
jgi:arylsulfatase A-like enzyme